MIQVDTYYARVGGKNERELYLSSYNEKGGGRV